MVYISSLSAIFARVYTAKDAENVLNELINRWDYPAQDVALLDIPPTEGSLVLCRALMDSNKEVAIFDHHLPELNDTSLRAKEVQRLSEEIGETIGAWKSYRQHRSDHPGCATTMGPGGVSKNWFLIADQDPDGILTALHARCLGWSGLVSDCAVLDGPPSGRSSETLSAEGWLVARAWSSLPPTISPGGQEEHDKFVGEVVELATTGNREALEIRAEEYAKMVEAVYGVWEAREEDCRLPGCVVLDQRKVRADRSIIDRLANEAGYKVVVSILNFGSIAKLHGGVQYSCSRTDVGEAAGVNLQDYMPEGVVSGPESGVNCNTQFLLHLSYERWRALGQKVALD